MLSAVRWTGAGIGEGWGVAENWLDQSTGEQRVPGPSDEADFFGATAEFPGGNKNAAVVGGKSFQVARLVVGAPGRIYTGTIRIESTLAVLNTAPNGVAFDQFSGIVDVKGGAFNVTGATAVNKSGTTGQLIVEEFPDSGKHGVMNVTGLFLQIQMGGTTLVQNSGVLSVTGNFQKLGGKLKLSMDVGMGSGPGRVDVTGDVHLGCDNFFDCPVDSTELREGSTLHATGSLDNFDGITFTNAALMSTTIAAGGGVHNFRVVFGNGTIAGDFFESPDLFGGRLELDGAKIFVEGKLFVSVPAPIETPGLILLHGGDLEVFGDTIVTWGKIIFENGFITPGPTSLFRVLPNEPGATLVGPGTIDGSVVNDGNIILGDRDVPNSPPTNIGVLLNYTQSNTGTLDVRLLAAGVNDSLDVGFTAQIGGTLVVHVNYMCHQGDLFHIVHFGNGTVNVGLNVLGGNCSFIVLTPPQFLDLLATSGSDAPACGFRPKDTAPPDEFVEVISMLFAIAKRDLAAWEFLGPVLTSRG
jgi:hypothetical protein